jgi:ParB-like chromosome segregation protein Spo0J
VTAARVARWRAERAKKVTHTAARKVGPSAIVAELGAALSAMETGMPPATSEETSHEHSPEEELAQRAQDVGAGAGELEKESGEGAPANLRTDAAVQPGAADVAAADVARSTWDEDVGGEPADEEAPAALRNEVADPRCARCGRAGVEEMADTDEGIPSRYARPARRTGSAPCTMTTSTGMTKPCPIERIGTTLSRARCRLPARIERMKQSLASYGQLTPLVAVPQREGVELVDGFKRLAAATTLGWATLLVAETPLDETGQWATMLLLNRGPSSMTTLEEGLVLRELCKAGLTQADTAALCSRHTSWVNRRIGLVERLHPELVESMKLGVLHPGSARRLLSLPPGNQLEMAAVIGSARLGPRDTELLVSLWRRTKDPAGRRRLLSEPRASLEKHHPETRRPPLDPRLSPEGQRLSRCLHRLEAITTEASRRLRALPPKEDLAVLSKVLRAAQGAASRLTTELGSARTIAGASESEGSGATT